MKRTLVGLVLALVTLESYQVGAARRADLVTLKGEVLGILGKAARLAPRPGADKERVTISVILNRSDPAAFETFAKAQEALMRRGTFRPWSPEELTARFGPSKTSYDSVLAYLRKGGFAIAKESHNRLTIAATGTRAQARRAFGIEISDYRLGDRLFYANDREPTVPRSLAPAIRALWGLSNLHRWRRAGQPPDPNSATSIRVPYGINGAAPDGTGQVIGILALNDYNDADIAKRLALTGLTPVQVSAMMARLHRVLVYGPEPPDSEPELDVDAVMNIAPAASSFTVFIGPNGDDNPNLPEDFPHFFNVAEEYLPSGSGARVLSFSYLDCESAFMPNELTGVDYLIQQANLRGISFFAASGDSGATCLFDNSAGEIGVSFPASAPHAIGVGGTILSVFPTGAYGTEAWWNNSYGSGGFGVSTLPAPAYQTLLTNSQNRSVPDVSAFAWPGIEICFGGACDLPPSFGTSLSTPLWAGMWTLIAESCGPSFNVASNGRLYSLPAHAFHSPATMMPPNNDFAHVGLGSPVSPSAACCGAQGQACCGGAAPGWCDAGLLCVNGTCACGGRNQFCCTPNGTCGAGLTCTGSLCLPPSRPSDQCSSCSTQLMSCVTGCGTDPSAQNANYCRCLCSAEACSCGSRCGVHCQPPVCSRDSE